MLVYELKVLDGLKMTGNRVVVPTSMRPRTLNRLHDATKVSLQCARRSVYWPSKATGWFRSVTNTKGMATRSPDLQKKHFSAARPIPGHGFG